MPTIPAMPPDQQFVLTLSCRDIECMVLARAVRWHVEHRVLIDDHKCVVFR